MSPVPRAPQAWLFSRSIDLGVFGGSALASFALLGLGALRGWLDRPVSPFIWLLTVLCVDVAHVWATLYRLYLDPRERVRLATLAWAAPVGAYFVGVLLYLQGPQWFWRALSYLATFHFVRQQWGWVALYKRVNGDFGGRFDELLDRAAVYTATLYPLLWWHAHLPRSFHWLAPGDYVQGLPEVVARALHAPHFAVLALWALRQAHRAITPGARVSVGKILVVVTTWACWYVGIVALDSDYAFTVTNVLVHGVPYMALVWRYAARRFGAASSHDAAASSALPAPTERVVTRALATRVVTLGVPAFLVSLVALALCEELLWDQLVWHERGSLFGDLGLRLPGGLLGFVVPLLAVPQASHYALDGLVWRGGVANPSLRGDLSLGCHTRTE